MASTLLSLALSARADDADAYHRDNGDESAVASHPDWMSWLPDSTNLAVLSIPGTHDAMTFNCPGGIEYEWCNTQSMNTTAQLQSGIRALDVRIRQRDNGATGSGDDYLTIAHGGQDMVGDSGDMDLSEVLDDVCGFLASHDTETVIIRLTDNGLEERHDNWYDGVDAVWLSDSILDVIRSYVTNYRSCIWLPDDTFGSSYNGEIPDLGDVRGRIMLVPGGDGGGGIRANDYLLEFGPYDIEQVGGGERYLTAEAFENHAEEAVDFFYEIDGLANPTKLYYNQTNANGGGGRLGRPLEYAGGTLFVPRGINERIADWLLGVNDVRGDDGLAISKTGIVMMDFPSASFIQAVLAHNIDLATNVNLVEDDLWEMIKPFAHHVENNTSNNAQDRHDAMDAIFNHFIQDSSLQSFTMRDDNKGAASRRDNTGVDVRTTGWVHNYYYAFWLSEGRVPVLSADQSLLLFSVVTSTASALGDKLSAEERKDAVAAAVAAQFSDYRIAVLVKEANYDENHFALNPLPGAPLGFFLNDDWAIFAWLYDGPQAPEVSLYATTAIDEGGVASFTAYGSDPDGDPLIYNWDFGDGLIVVDGGSSITHQYLDNGDYTVTVTITDPGGLSDTASITQVVHNVAPTIDGFSLSQAFINEGESVTVSGSFSDPALGVSTELFSGTATWSDGGTTTLTVDGTAGTFSTTRIFPDDHPTSGTAADDFTVDVAISDDDGGSGTAMSPTVTVNNVAPTIDDISVSHASIDEGQSVTVNGSFSDPALGMSSETFSGTATWSDGFVTALTVDGTAGTFSTTRSFPDDHPATGTAADAFTVDVTISDDDGGSGTATSPTVTVNNVAPTISGISVSQASIDEGQSVTVSGSFSDPAFGISSETFSGTATWSDGVATPVTVNGIAGTFSTTRSFPDDHPMTGTAADDFTVEVTISDDDGGSDTATSPTLAVNNVAPSALTFSATTIGENGTTTLSGTFSDPGLPDTFTLEIDWGDPLSPSNTQTISLGTSQSFTVGHQYLDDNPTGTATDNYTINVRVTDDDTGSTNGTGMVTVNNLDPDAAVTAVTDQVTGLAISHHLQDGTAIAGDLDWVLVGTTIEVDGRYTDVGTLDTHLGRINWDDGTGDEVLALFPDAPPNQSNGNTDTASHAYSTDLAPGTYAIVLTVTDDDTGASAPTAAIEVVDAAGALEHTLVDIQDVIDGGGLDPAAEMALYEVLYKITGNPLSDGSDGDGDGNDENGALDHLEQGNLNATLVKIRQAIQYLVDAEASDAESPAPSGVDMTASKAQLALTARSIVQSAIDDAHVVAVKQSELRKVADAEALLADGDAMLATGDYLATLDDYIDAIRKVENLVNP